MKPFAWIILSMAGLGLTTQAWSRPVDLSAPTGGVGAAGLYGQLEIWREIDDVGLQLGKGSYLPLRYKFTSDGSVGGMLGPGFYVPMFEAKNVLIREQMMRAYLPCGKGLYLRRDNVDATKFQTLDGEWTGSLYGDNGEDFVLWRDDGWKLLYHKGRLASLVTDDNHAFAWSYDGRGMPTDVSEDGHALITVEPNVAGQVAAFVFNDKRYEVTYAERPVTQILMGQTAIKELDQALSGFKYPDGSADTFKFALTPDHVPTVTFTDKDKKQTLYSWDAATNHIATEKGAEGNWNYKTDAPVGNSILPAISRTSPDGKIEGMAVDTTTGTYTSTALDGTTTVTKVFNSPGPLYHKVRTVEKTAADGETSTVYKASYDEAGRLMRNMDPNGFIITYDYNSEGQEVARHTTLPTDPVMLRKIKQRESLLLSALNNAPSGAKDTFIEKLAIFYVYQDLNPDKANALIPLATDPDLAYRIKFAIIEGDRDATETQKATQLKPLLKDFPYRADQLNMLIQMHEGTYVDKQ